MLPTFNSTFESVGKEHIEEILSQSKIGKCWAKFKLCTSMSHVKMLFTSPALFIFVDCNTLLSLG